ncbi:hypothetical protein OC844_002778, partial [Tilletia horrida]
VQLLVHTLTVVESPSSCHPCIRHALLRTLVSHASTQLVDQLLLDPTATFYSEAFCYRADLAALTLITIFYSSVDLLSTQSSPLFPDVRSLGAIPPTHPEQAEQETGAEAGAELCASLDALVKLECSLRQFVLRKRAASEFTGAIENQRMGQEAASSDYISVSESLHDLLTAWSFLSSSI